MIVISGFDVENMNTSQLSDLERDILNQKKKSQNVYRYNSPEALVFELQMRTSIVNAAKALDASDASFALFKDSRCNDQYWLRTNNGGFRLKSGVKPADAIHDIFENGRYYGFECATAMIIVLYKATLDILGEETFNEYFKDLYLRDWNYDSDLRLLITTHNNEAFPGDIVYFKNPEHAPEASEWQGENAVLLGDNLYFGHGIGIRTSQQMINALNRKRIPQSTKSAYLSDDVLHPDFENLRKLSTREEYRIARNTYLEDAVVARIGTHMYIHEKKCNGYQ